MELPENRRKKIFLQKKSSFQKPFSDPNFINHLKTNGFFVFKITHIDFFRPAENHFKDEIIEKEKQIIKELKDFENFDPYTFYYKKISGWCILTLKISLWALHWSYKKEKYPKIPKWYKGDREWPFDVKICKGFNAIFHVVMIGADADTYGATAGALLAAYHDIPENLKDKLLIMKDLKKLNLL